MFNQDSSISSVLSSGVKSNDDGSSSGGKVVVGWEVDESMLFMIRMCIGESEGHNVMMTDHC